MASSPIRYLPPPTLPAPVRRRTYLPPIAPEVLETGLRLAFLTHTVLPESTLLQTPFPTEEAALIALTARFHEEVATALFPHDPSELLVYARSHAEHLDLALTYIAPRPVGVPCLNCDTPPPGDLIHLLTLLDALSRPHPSESTTLQNTWAISYGDWTLPHGFHLEAVCLYLEDHPPTAPYTALPDVIRHALGYTGNWFLDACPFCWHEETEAWYWPTSETSTEDLDTLTASWHDARPRWQAICAFQDWLAEDALARRAHLFALLIDTHYACTTSLAT